MENPMRRVDELLDNYSMDHQNPRNQLIHVFCVPVIVWSATAMLWCIPTPSALIKPGAWCGLAMFLTLLYYWKLSRKLGAGLLVCFIVAGLINYYISNQFGAGTLFWTAVSAFVVAWVGQFIGHEIEGKRPSFLTDLVYLLVGPMWTLSKLYRRVGVKF
jgi:uncharacterized membrane protein YGL010W